MPGFLSSRFLSGPGTLALLLMASMFAPVRAGDFSRDVDVTWGGGRARILDDGRLLTLSLDKSSGSGFRSKREFLFAEVDMQLKLVPGNSAGTVTAYYLSSQGPAHDEIDIEFLGNVSGQPYTLHTNVYAQGKGGREQQFRLWFDPTKNFHNYSILWNPRHIIFAVDGIPIRDFGNLERIGVPFPSKQPMRLYTSLWNADDWATQGGRVKVDWSGAPFLASFRGLEAESCRKPAGCRLGGAWPGLELDAASRRLLRWVQRRYMIYSYCADAGRFPRGPPPECTHAAALH